MKALQITGYGKIEKNLAFAEVPKPTISENQVLVEVYAASINPIDYKIVEGKMKVIQSLDFPSSIGFDVSGVVVAIGKNVTNITVGDEIFSRVATESPGTFAEYVAIDSHLVCKKPENTTFEEAASFPLVGMTVMQSLETASLKSGDKVLIHAGSGGVGSFAIQYAKTKGATVYTTTSTSNVGWVKELGADRVIDYKLEDYKKIVSNADIVFDTLGGKYAKEAFDVLKEKGKVVNISGEIDPETADEMNLNFFIRLFLKLKFVPIKIKKEEKNAFFKFVRLTPNQKDLNELKELVESGAIKAVIDTVYPFEKAIEALKHQQTGHAKGKIILKMK